MVRSILHVVILFLFRVLTRLHIEGHKNIPEHGSALLASNHLHLLDAPLVFASVKRKDLVPLVGDSHRKTWWIRMLVNAVNGIWISRGTADTNALRAVIDHLKSGKMVGIAPEGTRSRTGTLAAGKTGIAYIADQAGVPIVPTAIWGTEEIIGKIKRLQRAEVHIHFGSAFQLPPLEHANRTEMLQHNTDEIMLRIAAMLPEKYRGVYQERPDLVKG